MDFIEDPDYEYEASAVMRQGTRVGTRLEFEDNPLSVGHDVENDYPNTVFIEYEDGIIAQELEHPVVKVVADDKSGLPTRITEAVAFNSRADVEEHVYHWNRLHPEATG